MNFLGDEGYKENMNSIIKIKNELSSRNKRSLSHEKIIEHLQMNVSNFEIISIEERPK